MRFPYAALLAMEKIRFSVTVIPQRPDGANSKYELLLYALTQIFRCTNRQLHLQNIHITQRSRCVFLFKDPGSVWFLQMPKHICNVPCEFTFIPDLLLCKGSGSKSSKKSSQIQDELGCFHGISLVHNGTSLASHQPCQVKQFHTQLSGVQVVGLLV